MIEEKGSDGRWIIMLALGRQCRLPFAPPARRREPIDAAIPRLYVCTGAEMYWVGVSGIVSGQVLGA